MRRSPGQWLAPPSSRSLPCWSSPRRPSYVDIQSVALPSPRASYLNLDGSPRVSALNADLTPLVGGSPACQAVTTDGTCTRDFLVFADGLYGGHGVTGVATRWNDD